eukprot:Polyplicarium_translucidae@DN3250_c0_g1_i3.p1
MSNGHACALQYAMLHLSGFGVSKDDLRNFRQLGSKTPGHPEAGVTPGVEVTTGPLGQGMSQAVGLAIGAHHMAARYNRPEMPLFDSHVFVVCGDGCLEEGVASEACSLAGHLRLGRLIALYDNNNITIDGQTRLSFTEDVQRRFEAYGWQVLNVAEGDTDVDGIVSAVNTAKATTDKPTLISVRTTIGFGSSKEGTEKVHGTPLGAEELKAVRRKFGFESDDWFEVPADVLEVYNAHVASNEAECAKWTQMFLEYGKKFSAEGTELRRRFDGELPAGLSKALPTFAPSDKANATRNLSHACLNAVANLMPEVVGGSADLTDSNKSHITGATDLTPADFSGRYIRFGVREHAMAAIMNGLHAFGGFRPFGATFLNFVTYAWGAVRLSALSHFGVLYIATHDSIELGEDGPTHQPVETLAMCRATPNLLTSRPADGNEVSAAYDMWMKNRTRPTVMALCRSNVPQLEGSSRDGALRGGYVLRDFPAGTSGKKVILGGCGSELHLVVAAAAELQGAGIASRVVSLPCWELFLEQPEKYRRELLALGDSSVTVRVYVEAAIAMGFADMGFDRSISMTTFGVSAPRDDAWAHFGFTPRDIANKVKAMCQ